MMRLPIPRQLSGHSFAALAPLVLGGVIGLATLQGGTAEAGRAHFSGSVRFSGHARSGVSVHFARPFGRSFWRPRARVWVGGSVWVGGYYPRPYYYYYYPETVPSYYGNSYYPVGPSAAPGVVAAPLAPPRPSLPTFGIGVAAGGSNVQGKQDTSDLSVLGRLRLTPGLLIEAELGKTSFPDNVRVDRRIGGSLIWEIGAYNTFAPYLLGGAGVQQADVNGSFSTTQDFAEAGVGLRLALSHNLALTVDIRAGRRKTIDSNQPDVVTNVVRTIAPPSGGNNNDTEDFTRARLAALLYF